MRYLVVFFLFLSFNFLYSKESVVKVINDSPYNITLKRKTGVSAKIESGIITNLYFSINSSKNQNEQHLYISYDVPIGNYNITVDADVRTVVLDEGKETLIIKKPENLKFDSYFIALQNASDNSIEMRTSSTIRVLYNRVGQTYIPMNAIGLFDYNTREAFRDNHVSDGFKQIDFNEEEIYENGHIYFYKYNGRNVVLEDVKKLSNIFDDNEEIYEKSLDLYNKALNDDKKNSKLKTFKDANSKIDTALKDYPHHSKYRNLKGRIENSIFEITKKRINKDAPLWATYVYNEFDKNKYIAATGIGNSVDEAYINAKNEIYDILGVVDNKQTVMSRGRNDVPRYFQIMINEFKSKYGRTIELDEIIDLEKVGEYYNKKDKQYYVAVTVEKNSFLLENTVNVNNKDVSNFLKKSNKEKDSLKKLSYLMQALEIVAENIPLAEKLNIISPDSSALKDVKNGKAIQNQIDEIVKNINFSIELEHDSGQIEAAIIDVLDSFDIPILEHGATYTIKDNLSYDTSDTGFGMYMLLYSHSFEIFNNTINMRVKTLMKSNDKEGGSTIEIALRVLRGRIEKSVMSNFDKEIENYFKSIIH